MNVNFSQRFCYYLIICIVEIASVSWFYFTALPCCMYQTLPLTSVNGFTYVTHEDNAVIALNDFVTLKNNVSFFLLFFYDYSGEKNSFLDEGTTVFSITVS